MSDWLNTTMVVKADIEKPCVKLGYCPYGQLVEEFPFTGEHGVGRSSLSCPVFGHDCPVHYHWEQL